MTASVSRPVTLLITELDDGGAERAFVRLAIGLKDRQWTPSIISLAERGPLVSKLEEAGISVTSLCMRATAGTAKTSFLSGFRQLVRLLAEQRPLVLQTYLFHANLLGRCAARLAGVPHVVSGIRVAERRSLWRLRCDRWTERWVDKHVCVSSAVADFSRGRSGLAADKLLVIPNGVDASAFQAAEPADLTAFGFQPEHEVVLSVGRLDPQKDPLLLCRAFERISVARPLARLLLVGAGPLEEELRHFITGRGLSERIVLAGRRADIASLMKAASCFALASRWEGMPNVLLEAAAARLPIVTTDVEGVSDLIRDRQSGRIVPIGDEGALAEALQATLADPQSARLQAAALEKRVVEHFTWDAVVTQYTELYESLVTESASS